MVVIMMLLMDMEKPGCHHRCRIGGAKYTIKKSNRHVLSLHFQKIQYNGFKERYKNQTVHTKPENSCTTTEYVTVTLDMCQNILFPIFKGGHTVTTYYL